MGAEHRFVRFVGLNVTDPRAYSEYREQMTPILLRHGGDFEYDFAVSEVLKQPTPAAINRVFSIVFTSEQACEAFFADPEYLAVRMRFFEPAVSSVSMLATFHRA